MWRRIWVFRCRRFIGGFRRIDTYTLQELSLRTENRTEFKIRVSDGGGNAAEMIIS